MKDNLSHKKYYSQQLEKYKIHAPCNVDIYTMASITSHPPPLFLHCSESCAAAKITCVAQPMKPSWRLSKLTGFKSLIQNGIIANCLGLLQNTKLGRC